MLFCIFNSACLASDFYLVQFDAGTDADYNDVQVNKVNRLGQFIDILTEYTALYIIVYSGLIVSCVGFQTQLPLGHLVPHR